MKKLLAFLIVPGLFLFGCSKVNEEETNDVIPDEEVAGPEIVAHIDEAELEYTNGTKTTLEGSGPYSIHWEAGDLIKLFNNTNTSVVLKAVSSGSSSKFVKNYSYATLPADNTGPYKAFYPQGIYANQSELSAWGLNVGDWESRNYAEDAGKVTGYPMMAITESSENYNVLNFKNLMGIVKINLPSVAGITDVIEITVSADEKMSGVGTYQADGDSYVFVPHSTKGTNYKTVSYRFTTIDLSSVGFSEYVSVAAGTYNNFKIEVKTGGKTATRTAKVPIVVERSKITEITLNSLTFVGLEGSGTQADPFQLSTVADFEYLAAHADGSSYNYYKLMDNITFDSPVTPIGNSSTPFAGYFDGDDHTVTINNGFDTSDQYIGLFGSIVDGEVKNIRVVGADITIGSASTAVNKYYGAVVGGADHATVQNCTNAINVSVPKATGGRYGGVIGSWEDTSTSKTLSGCSNTGNIIVTNGTNYNPGSFDVGGVCGHIR